jgi:hypothetical protein
MQNSSAALRVDQEPPQTGKEVPCAYCDTSVVGTSFVMCSACDVPVHRDCWGEAARCPTYACGSTEVVDPAVALFRKPAKASAAADAPLEISGDEPQKPAAPPAPTPAPAAAAPPNLQPPPLTGWRGALRDGLGIYLGGGVKYSAVNIDVDTGFLNPLLWLEAFNRVWTKIKQPPVSPVPLDATALANVRRETTAIETALTDLRQRRWKRTMGIMCFGLLMPMICKFISKSLFFPWMCAGLVWMTWPGWNLKGSKRKEKAMRLRLEELYRLEARGKGSSY